MPIVKGRWEPRRSPKLHMDGWAGIIFEAILPGLALMAGAVLLGLIFILQ